MIMWWLIYSTLLYPFVFLGLGDERAKLYLSDLSEPWGQLRLLLAR